MTSQGDERRASSKSLRTVVVSMGCPSGIGPEVSVKAISTMRGSFVLVGDVGVARRAATRVGVDPARIVSGLDPFSQRRTTVPASRHARVLTGAINVFQPGRALSAADAKWGKPSVRGGEEQLRWIDVATDFVISHANHTALVTAPVNKEAIVKSGVAEARGFTGHTERLQQLTHAPSVTMCFWHPEFTSALVTTHLPLARIPAAITRRAVCRAIVHLARFLMPIHNGELRLAVCGLNPHAGEGGLLGSEEARIIAPAIADARIALCVPFASGPESGALPRARAPRAQRRVLLDGPVPAESAFRLARDGHYHGVVAMYHDQATIPMKLIGFGDAVNVTLGLPIIRTSVDHGTAYNIAGKGTADASGMRAAIKLANTLLRERGLSKSMALGRSARR